MSPRVLVVDPVTPEPSVIAEAVSVLRARGLVAMPTETCLLYTSDAADE